MEFSVNGKNHEIKTVTHHTQCKEYYKALEAGDGYAAHMLHIPPTHKPWWMIESEMRMIELHATYEAEIERIKKMPPELLKIEVEMDLGIKAESEQPKKRRTFLFIPLPIFFNF